MSSRLFIGICHVGFPTQTAIARKTAITLVWHSCRTTRCSWRSSRIARLICER